MNSAYEQLHFMGWDEWFDAKAQENGLTGERLARVVAVRLRKVKRELLLLQHKFNFILD